MQAPERIAFHAFRRHCRVWPQRPVASTPGWPGGHAVRRGRDGRSPSSSGRSRWNDRPAGPKAPMGVGLSSRPPLAAIACCAPRIADDRNAGRAARRSAFALTVAWGRRWIHPLAAGRRRSKDHIELVRSRRQLHPSTNTTHSPWSSLATPSMGFVASRRNQRADRYVGLPHRRHPLSEFLAPSAV